MTDCQIRGCRNLYTACKDCGRIVSTASCGDQWISVKDRLPPFQTPVLCIFKYSDNHPEDILLMWLLKETGKIIYFSLYLMDPYEGVWYTDCSGTYFHDSKWGIDYVTHWMPLPEPPK